MFKKKRSDPFERLGKDIKRVLTIESSFHYGDLIDDKYTCYGDNVSPPIRVSGIPDGTKSLALLMYDVDAPTGVAYHWVLYNTPVVQEIPENLPKEPTTQFGSQGINDFGSIGYNGPCPKAGDRKHHYIIMMLALKTDLKLKPKARAEEVLAKARGKILGYGVTMFTYIR